MVEILLKISNHYSKEWLSSFSLEIRSVEPTIDGDGTQRRLQLRTASNETARVTSSAQTLLTAEQLPLPVPPEDDDWGIIQITGIFIGAATSAQTRFYALIITALLQYMYV